MRKTLLLLSFVLPALTVNAGMFPPPTIPASGINFTSLDGAGYRVNWTSGNGARRIVIMREGSAVTSLPANGIDYNASSTFGNGDQLAPGEYVVFDGVSSLVDVSGLQPGTTYHVAIFEYNGTASGTEYLTSTFPAASQSTLSAPTTQVSNIVFSNITGNSMTLTWSNGNGQRRLVIARQGSAVNANPVDLTTYSNASNFGSGTQIGSGNYSVYASTGNSVTVSNLQPNTTYHYSLHEYNGSSGPVYMIPGATASATTAPRPTIAASNLTFGSVDGGFMRVNWSNGNGARRIVVARAGSAVTSVPVDGVDYNASTTFGAGDAIQPGEYVVYDGTSTFVDLANLQPGTTYHFRVFEYDGAGANIAYLTSSFPSGSQTTLSAPTIQASNLNFTNVSGSSVTLNWTNGNGTRRIVLGRQGSAVNADPVNLTFYSGNSIFGNGSQIGTGNYAVYAGNGNSVTITNLQINTTYHFAVYESNGSSTPVYHIPGAAASVTTPASPTAAATNVSFNGIDGGSFRISWTNGNGQRRIVVARAGSPVTSVPVDGVDYNANAAFGNGDVIQPNEYVVFDGTTTFVDLSNLQAATTYHFRIYEYNGTGSNTAYLTSLFGSGSQATLSAPTTQASAVNFTNIGGSNVQVNWTNGNGTGRIALMRQGSAVNADPVNLSFYSGNSIFGNGAQIGSGNYVVFRGPTVNTTTVTNLTPGTTYHVAVYDYNGSSTPVYAVPGAINSFTTAAQPTIPPSSMTFTSLEGNSMRVNWNNGNGQRRILIARAGSAVTAAPANGVDYNASSVFGNGDQLAPSQFVIFDGTSAFADISNLAPNTTYHFAVFEYDGTGGNTAYLTSTFLSGSQATLGAPTLQASNILFSSVGATALTAGWTVGNGSARLLLARQGSPVNADPVDLTIYNGNAAFGSGPQIGTGNYIVYRSGGTTVNITGLTSGTTYHFALYEMNGSSGPVYAVPPARAQITTPGAPQIQAVNATAGSITTNTMQLTWTNGSGNRRLVLMKQGSAVDANPVNNAIYSANSFFGSGTEIGSGNYVVFDGTASNVLVTGLTNNTTYYFAVFEYNSFGVASSQFLLTNPATGNATTASGLPVTFLDFRATAGNKFITLEWATAQEQNSSHFVILKSTDGVDFRPIGRKDAAVNSVIRKDYAFVDASPAPGTNYYRLQQVDADGRFMYSKIVSVQYARRSIVKNFLNPLRNSLHVQLADGASGTWKLINMQGQLLLQGAIHNARIHYNTASLPEGMYVLEIILKDHKECLKLVKANQ